MTRVIDYRFEKIRKQGKRKSRFHDGSIFDSNTGKLSSHAPTSHFHLEKRALTQRR